MSFWHRLLSHRCALCITPASTYICAGCSGDLPRLIHACPACGLPLGHLDQVCGDCLRTPKPFHRTVCAFAYAHPVNYLVKQLKQKQPQSIVEALGPTLIENLHVRYAPNEWPDLLVPVPLHWFGRLGRGFNQAQVLSDYLAQQTGCPSRALLRRKYRSGAQKSLDRRKRLHGIKGVFSCTTSLQGQRLAIVDDVVTTGATAMEVARCLLAAGAANVDLWALARTPKP